MRRDVSRGFESEYQREFPDSVKANKRLRELAEEYHELCETYDRTVCRNRNNEGIAIPSNGFEAGMIEKHAVSVRLGLWSEVEAMGFTWKDWLSAIRRADQ